MSCGDITGVDGAFYSIVTILPIDLPVEIISKGRSKVQSIMRLMRRLTYHTALNNFVVHSVHIAGVENNIADAISRFQMKPFRALAPDVDILASPCLRMSSLMKN